MKQSLLGMILVVGCIFYLTHKPSDKLVIEGDFTVGMNNPNASYLLDAAPASIMETELGHYTLIDTARLGKLEFNKDQDTIVGYWLDNNNAEGGVFEWNESTSKWEIVFPDPQPNTKSN